jgi:hypothetical protein
MGWIVSEEAEVVSSQLKLGSGSEQGTAKRLRLRAQGCRFVLTVKTSVTGGYHDMVDTLT